MLGVLQMGQRIGIRSASDGCRSVLARTVHNRKGDCVCRGLSAVFA
jgi:hypothetical protein